jgi:adenylate kinase
MVVNLEVPTHAVLRRLAARRVCEDCGTNYSVSSPPAIRGTCDVCGGEVVQREDDTEEAITRRLELYARQTAPLLDFYRKAHLLATVNGTGSADMVTRRVVRAIDRQLMDDRGRPRSEGD